MLAISHFFWHASNSVLAKGKKPIAYFCAEFGIDSELPTYSGGLGVLAGDTVSAAADKNMPFVGIGILYKGKAFVQHITGDGREEKRDSQFDHDASFLRQTTKEGKTLLIEIPAKEGKVLAKSYHIRLADNTILFFLSTNVDGNPQIWKSDMDALYRGDDESQIRQQILLGVGGARLLELLDIKPKLFHINEGRPGFVIWEITKQIMDEENKTLEKAWEKAKKKIVYTNHTLVSAGNPKYPEELVKNLAEPAAKELETTPDKLIKEGIRDGKFDITYFALNISSKHSAVSKVHGEYARNEWPDYNWTAITNGVHMPRWQDSDFRKRLSERELWDLHMAKKKELAETVKKRTGFTYDPERLVVSWARRLAGYKQPRAIFKDVERIKSIIANNERPVQILFAGNSHSADPNAKAIIEEIIDLFASKLSGYAIFVPNYNISLANHLVSGSDVWLNTPKGNLEACGTSGIKAISNGVLSLTVIDGWTHELDWEGIGWTLDPENIDEDFYSTLENEVVPLYYKKDKNGLPGEWIKRMKKSIEASEAFSAEIMLEKYQKLLYSNSGSSNK